MSKSGSVWAEIFPFILITAVGFGFPAIFYLAESAGPDVLKGVVSVSTGTWHTCALLKNGNIYCWGSNSTGQLGKAGIPESKIPNRVEGLPPMAAIASGQYHSCALGRAGSVWCWGDNSMGQIGDGDTKKAETPVKIPGLQDVAAIAAGTMHNCALTGAGKVYCWGSNSTGQLGNGSSEGPVKCLSEEQPYSCGTSPVQVVELEKVHTISAGGNQTCAVTGDSIAYCWGLNDRSQVGVPHKRSPDRCELNGYPYECSTKPVAVNAANVTDVYMGGYNACIRDESGTVKCWGPNKMGQLGNGTSKGTTRPKPVKIGSKISTMSAGLMHDCAITVDGRVFCWGNNSHGQIGVDRESTPSGVAGLSPNSRTPIAVRELSGAKTVSCGGDHSCAVLSDETVKCWGNSEFGKLGTGTKSVYKSTPERVLNFIEKAD